MTDTFARLTAVRSDGRCRRSEPPRSNPKFFIGDREPAAVGYQNSFVNTAMPSSHTAMPSRPRGFTELPIVTIPE